MDFGLIWTAICIWYNQEDDTTAASGHSAGAKPAKKDKSQVPPITPLNTTQDAGELRWEPSEETLLMYREHIMKNQDRLKIPWMAPTVRLDGSEPKRFRPNPTPLTNGPSWYFGSAWRCGGRFNASMVSPIVGIRPKSRSRLVQKVGGIDFSLLPEPRQSAPSRGQERSILPNPTETRPYKQRVTFGSTNNQLDNVPGSLAILSPVSEHGRSMTPAAPPSSVAPLEKSPSVMITASVLPTTEFPVSQAGQPDSRSHEDRPAESVPDVLQSPEHISVVPDTDATVHAPESFALQSSGVDATMEPAAPAHIPESAAAELAATPQDLNWSIPQMKFPNTGGNSAARPSRRPTGKGSAVVKKPQAPSQAGSDTSDNALYKELKADGNSLFFGERSDKTTRAQARKLMTERIEELNMAAKKFPDPYCKDQFEVETIISFSRNVYTKFRHMHEFATYNNNEKWNEQVLQEKYAREMGVRKGKYLTVLGRKLKNAADKSPVGHIADAYTAYKEFDKLFEAKIAPRL